MNFDKTYGFFDSTNGTDRIAYYIYTPHKDVKAVIQLSHDMCRYTEMYENFIDYLCRNGFAVFSHDHLGHGNSVSSPDNYGYFSAENGWHYLVKDMRKMTNIVKEHYPQLPVFLFGHNLGSLVIRAYMTKYVDKINGAVLFGKFGRSNTADIGIVTAGILCRTMGDKYRACCLEQLLFGRCRANTSDEFDRICGYNNDVGKYITDDSCGFTFTSKGFLDLFYLQAYVSQKAWAGKISRDIPILIMCSEDNPECKYAEVSRRIFSRLCSAEMKNAEIYIYEKNENIQIKNRIYKDILSWISKQL